MNAERQAFLREFNSFRVEIPEGMKSGPRGTWEIRKVTMSEKQAWLHNAMEQVMRCDRWSVPGVYTLLVHTDLWYKETVVMSDHECEVADHAALVNYARSRGRLRHVLINGLGLGVAIQLLMPYVDRFTIVELSNEVIHLVEPTCRALLGDRLTIIREDALTYKPPKGTRYDAVFHDIWSFISEKNLPEMRQLHYRYGRLCDWQASWAREYCERRAARRKQRALRFQNPLDPDEVLKTIYQMYGLLPKIEEVQTR